MNKVKILKAIRKYYDDSILQLLKKIEEYKMESDLEESAVLDPEDMSNQSAAVEMLQYYKSLLEQTRFNRNKLDSFPNTSGKKIQAGTVVVTKQVIFYMGVPTSPLPFDENKLLIGLSLEAPLAKKLKSKKIGDSLPYGKLKLAIQNIF